MPANVRTHTAYVNVCWLGTARAVLLAVFVGKTKRVKFYELCITWTTGKTYKGRAKLIDLTYAFVPHSGVSQKVAEGKDFRLVHLSAFGLTSNAGSSTKTRRSKGIVTSFVDSDVIR